MNKYVIASLSLLLCVMFSSFVHAYYTVSVYNKSDIPIKIKVDTTLVGQKKPVIDRINPGETKSVDTRRMCYHQIMAYTVTGKEKEVAKYDLRDTWGGLMLLGAPTALEQCKSRDLYFAKKDGRYVIHSR